MSFFDLPTLAGLAVAAVMLGIARFFWRAGESACLCSREAIAPAVYCPEHGHGV